MALPNGVGTALSEISAILKDMYLPPVVEQLVMGCSSNDS